MKKHQLNRRLLLKGVGSVAIGLPLLGELYSEKVWAQDNVMPYRLLTLSFGLGLEKSLQDEGWNGPLEPLKDIAHKGAMFSNMRNDHLRGGGEPHFEVGATVFTGIKQQGFQQANGPSLEQAMRMHFHPNGVPSINGLLSKSAGIWSRTGAVPQYMRVWNADGSPGERPERRPSKVFDAIFGSINPALINSTDLAVQKELRIRRSVLDSVNEDYMRMTGANSYLGQESKDRINNHFETIRAIEKNLIEGDIAASDIEMGEQILGLPNSDDYLDPPGIPFYDAPSGPQTGPITHWQEAQKAFRLIADLYVLGLSMDALRFGNLIFVGAGEHLRFDGTYNATNIGDSLNFGRSFASRSPHDGILHSYVRSSFRVYQHYVISQLAYALKQMDNVTEANGKTILDNTLSILATEYGYNHEGSGNIFHALFGGNGKFKLGTKNNSNIGYNNLYKTALDAYGVRHSIPGDTINGLLI